MPQHIIGSAKDFLSPHEMTQIEVGGTEVVIARSRSGSYHAFGAYCTHAGAPLHTGLIQGDTVMCPWHHACFDLRSGHRLQPPALDDLPSYPLETNADGQLVLTLTQRQPVRPFDNRAAPEQTFVIVGGGAAGHAAIEEIRRCGFRGRLVLLTAEPHLPIDRTRLSKSYLQGSTDALRLRDRDWYAEQDVETVFNARLTRLDAAQNVIYFSDDVQADQPLAFDRLLLAIGSVPRPLPDTPPMDNVFLLRTRRDADRLLAQVGAGKHAVVVGGSFIAVEAAASLRARGVDVTVIAPHDAPFAHVFGGRVGTVIQQHHERKNSITFQTGRRVKRITKHHGRAAGVELDDWTTVRADLVLLGLGVQPNTDFLRASTLNMGNDGSLIVNKHLQTNVPGVYAAGDIARYENRRGMSERVEHWRTAQQHGVLAARNMMGAAESVDDLVPFFWSRQRGGLGLLYVGHAAAWEDIVYRGDVEAGNFIAFYLENDRLRAAVSLGRDKEMCALEFILHNRLPLSPAQMQDDTFDLIAYAQRPR